MSTWDELNKGAGASKVTVASTWDDANKGAGSWAEEERKRKQEEEARKAQEQSTVQPVEQPRKTGEYRGNIFQKLGQSYFDVIKSIPKQTARGVGMVFNAPENVAQFTSNQLMKNDSYEKFMVDAARGIDLGQGRAAVATLNTAALGIGDLKPVLNTKVGKDIVTNVADRTSDIPIKTVAAFRAIGEGTYKEYRDAMLEDRNNPENGAAKKFLYELQDSGIQSLLGVLITTGTVLATRNPKAGYAIGGAYYGALSASEQIKTQGEVTSSGNIYIDVIGDSLINNALLGVFKMPAAAITRVLATGALEGSTEVVQTLLKFGNSYTQAKTDTERQDIMEDAVQYVKSGAILMEFGVGATVGTIAGGASEVLNTYSQQQVTELETQRESESKAVIDLGIEERIKRAKNQPIPLYRGQEQGSEGGLHFSDNQKWAGNFGGQNNEVLTGTLPADAKIMVLDDSDIRVAADLGYTTDEEMYSYYFSMGYDAIVGTDSRNNGELDVIVSPEASEKFDIQPVPVNLGDSTTEVLNTAGSKGKEKKEKPKGVPVAPRKLQEDIQEVADLLAKADSGQELSVAEQNALPQARESFIDYANAFQATTVSLPNEVAPQEPPITQVQVVDVGDKFALKYSADAGEMALYVDYDLKTLYSSPEAANKAAIDSILQWIGSQRNNGGVSPVTQKRLEDIAQKLKGGSEKAIKAPKQPAKRQKETDDASMVSGIDVGTEVYFAGRPRKVTAIIPFGGDTKYQLTDEKGNYIYTNEAGVKTAIEAKELGISEDEVLKRRNEANGTPKKEKGKVEEKVKVRFDEELGYLALVKKGDGFVVIGTFSTEEKAIEHLKEVTGIDVKTTEKDTKQPEIDEKSSKKTQKDKVKEVIDEKGTATIKDIADITGILEPNIRRILGVGAKDGEFERVDSGVYRLAVGDKDVAFIMAADAVETLPKLAAQGFKADMIFLDIPYETKAVKGGNRGVNYDFLSVADFRKVVFSIKTIVRDENTPIIHMYSQAESGMKEMTAYNEVFTDLDFKPVAKGEWQKTYKDGSPVAFPTRNGSMVTKPEGILVFTLSGETDKQLESLQFKTVRPKGYQTEKSEEMLKAMIEMTTEEGDVVFDPFAGSGVTGAAAVKAGRRTVAIEKNPEVVEQFTKPRIESAAKQKRAVLPSTKKKAAEKTTYQEGEEAYEGQTDEAIKVMQQDFEEAVRSGQIPASLYNFHSVLHTPWAMFSEDTKETAKLHDDILGYYIQGNFDKQENIEALLELTQKRKAILEKPPVKEEATSIRLSQKQKEDRKSFVDDVAQSKTYDFKYAVGEPVLVNGEKAIIKERYIDRGRARYVTYPPSKKSSVAYHTQSYEENIQPRDQKTSPLIPKVLYHGTLETFEQFDSDKKGENTAWNNASWGFFFIEDQQQAKNFVEETRQIGDSRDVQIKKVKLNIKNPIDLTMDGVFANEKQAGLLYEIMTNEKADSNKEAAEWIEENVGLGEIGEFYDALYSDLSYKKLIEDAGYDGIISGFGRDEKDNLIKEYVAFYPEQIEVVEQNIETAADTAAALQSEEEPVKAEMVKKNANTLTIVPDSLEDDITYYKKTRGAGETQAKNLAKDNKRLKGDEIVERPDTKVGKAKVKDFLAGRDRVVFTVMVEEDGNVHKQIRAGTMYLYEKSETTETYLRPSALGLVEEGLQIGQEVVLDATELKKSGAYFNAVDGAGNVLAEGLFTKKYDPEKHEKYFVDYRPKGFFGGNHYIFAIPKGQGAFYRNIIDDARTKSGRLATGHEDVNGKGIWHVSSTPYKQLVNGGAIYKGEVNDRIKRQLQINKKALLESYKKKSSALAEEAQPKSRKAIRTIAESEFAAVSKLVQKAEPAGKRPSSFASREPQNPSKLQNLELNTENLRKGDPIEFDKLAKRSEIARVLTSKLNAVVRAGKFRQSANGIYKPDSDVVRLSNKNFSTREGGQLTTLIHEIGHYIDYSWQEFRKVIPKNEIDPLLENYGAGAASVAKSKRRAEAFAEFVRYYVTIPAEAQSRAPEFYKYFVNALEGLPEVKDALNTAQSEFRRWAEQPATAKVAAQISFEQKDNDSIKTKLNTTVNAIYRDAVNDLHAIDQFSKLAQKNGKQIEADQDPAILARNMRGWIGRAQYFLESGTINRDYWRKGENGRFYVDKKGKSLKEILQPVEDKGALNDLSVYLVARRAIELADRNITSGVTEADARVALAELGEKYPEFSQVALDLDTYQNHLLDYLQQSGVLNKDDRAKMQEANKMYTPFFRVHEELTNNGYMGGKKIPTRSPIKRIKGSEKDIIDPLESIVKNTYVLLNAAERNNVMLAMANLSKTDKALGRLFEPVPVDQTKVASVSAKDIVYEALGANTEMGKLMLPAEVQAAIDIVVPETMVNIFRPAMFQKGNVVSVLEDGKPKYYELDKDLYDAVQSTEVEEVIAAVKILSYPAQFLRAGATLTPEFMLRNPLRDSIGAAVQSQNGFVPFYDTFRGFASLIKKDAYYDAFVISGGLQSTIVAQDRTNLQQSKDELLKRSVRIKKFIKNPLEVLQVFSAYTEQATRIGEARLALNAGKSPTQAAFDAREVTLDFQRAGAKTRSINKLSAFFNAKIQGNDKLMRTFLKNPAKATFKATLYITLPSVILWLLNQDEEGWDEIPQWQKDMFWLVKVDDTWYRIPKPFELGVLFGSIPERFLEYLKENDPEGLQEVTRSFITGLVPNPTPTGAVPILENITNYSFFLDRPIVSQSLENLPAAAQYTNTTTEVAKIIGEALNYSPAKIDNLIYGYFAGLGRHAVNTTDAVLKGTGIVNSVPEPAPTLADTPVVKAFVVSNPAGSSSNSVNDFYESRTEVTKKYNRYKDIAETGDANKAREYLADNPDIKLYKAYNTVASQISEIRKARDAVYNSSSMSPEDKRKKIDELNKLMTDTAYRANHLELQ